MTGDIGRQLKTPEVYHLRVIQNLHMCVTAGTHLPHTQLHVCLTAGTHLSHTQLHVCVIAGTHPSLTNT